MNLPQEMGHPRWELAGREAGRETGRGIKMGTGR